MNNVTKISSTQLAGVLGRLFKVKEVESLAGVMREIDDHDIFNLPFRLSTCGVLYHRFSVIGTVSVMPKKLTDLLAEAQEAADNGLILVSDSCRSGGDSLFLMCITDDESAGDEFRRLMRHAYETTSPTLGIIHERPNRNLFAIQLKSLLPL